MDRACSGVFPAGLGVEMYRPGVKPLPLSPRYLRLVAVERDVEPSCLNEFNPLQEIRLVRPARGKRRLHIEINCLTGLQPGTAREVDRFGGVPSSRTDRVAR